MNKLLQELLRNGEITVAPWRVTAKGGFAILIVFLLGLIMLL